MSQPGATPGRDPFDEGASDYDVMVDWDARLGREVPFFLERFEAIGAKRVLDLGAGTGRHAAEFARAGYTVIAMDPSEAMLDRAREHAAATGVTLDVRIGGFGDVTDALDEPVDAVVVLGNALMHVEGVQGARETLEDIAPRLRAGGIIVLHFLNHDRLLANRPRMMPSRYREVPEGEVVFVRLLSYPEDLIGSEFIRLARASGEDEWTVDSRRTTHVPLGISGVVDALEASGFADVELLGGHDGTPFDPDTHESVIMVARRAGA